MTGRRERLCSGSATSVLLSLQVAPEIHQELIMTRQNTESAFQGWEG